MNDKPELKFLFVCFIPLLISACSGDSAGNSFTKVSADIASNATSAATQTVVSAQVSGTEVTYSNSRGVAEPRTRTLLNPVPAYTGKLTDTGVSAAHCYGAGSNSFISCGSPAAIALNANQDGMVGRDVSSPAYADGVLGFSYSLVPNQAGGTYDKTECLKDNVTGLTWEGKLETGLRTNTNTYTNFDSTTKLQKYQIVSSNASSTIYTYVAPTQAEIDAPTNAAGYKTAINATSLCGFTDWRLPTADELHSLVNVGVAPLPAIDNDWFPNTLKVEYWSSSAAFTQASNAWKVTFWDGGVFYNKYNYDEPFYGDRHIRYPVRLVRGASAAPATRFTYINAGTEVADAQTNLIWRRCVEGMSWNGATCIGADSRFTREQALAQAQSQTGWRLPNIKELTSIVDRSTSSPAFNASIFPVTPMFGLWTSTPFIGVDTSIEGGWYVDAVTGTSAAMFFPTSAFSIRLVKDVLQ